MLAGAFLIIVFGGLVALLLTFGIIEHNWIEIIVGVIIAVFIVIAICNTTKKAQEQITGRKRRINRSMCFKCEV
ncbi:hypothetical protein SAMN02910456_00593 [Ruminococcaceae bacterium YRB3002]|nr:hypothetical protein SAMN02910456_00593 [Ruminococcaceae bacterium YRB3002]